MNRTHPSPDITPFVFVGALASLLVAAAPALAQQDIMADPLIQSVINNLEKLRIIKGELTTVDVKGLQRVSVGDPQIADIVSAEGDELVVIGKASGETPLFIWDADGRRTVNIYVLSESLDDLQKRVEKLLIAGGIEGVKVEKNEDERIVMITGNVLDSQKEKFEKIAEPFEDNGQAIILVNQGRVEDMVQVDLQITEVSSTLFRRIGVDWHTGEVEREDTTLGGQDIISQTTTVNEDTPFAPDIVEALPIFGKGNDLSSVGKFWRSQALVARINAMVEEGDAKVLSKPKLVVLSGEEASFLVGGEVPIRTSTTNQNGVSENVEFKEYGVGMTIVPTVKKDKVDIVLNMDITDIDRANATDKDLAFLVRNAQTHLQMDDGETVVLAGLIKSTNNEIRTRVPYLGKVPVLGMLFRSKRTPVANEDTELVFSMTPHILRDEKSHKTNVTDVEYQPIAKAPVSSMPTKAEADPADADMKTYLASVQEMIAQAVVYPPEAMELGWEGTVKINMMILNDGTLAFALVEQSSGFDVIDRSALNLVRSLSYPAFPSNSQKNEITLNVPIVYSAER